MALFSQKNAKKAPAKKTTKAAPSNVSRDLSSVLLSPRITEKAMRSTEKNVYAFTIARDAGKNEVKQAVKQFFGVTPVKVNIVNKAPRQYKSRSRGRVVTEPGLKKAYVYLKDGDSISLM